MRRIAWIAIVLLAAGVVLADDGEMFRKNVSKTPDLETEHAALRMLPLYVPAQSSAGELLDPIVYYDADGGALDEEREYARPLVAFYTDGHVEGIDAEGYGGFPGHGERDAFGAVSLDDGASWLRSNLSNSASLSSIDIRDGKKWVPYPGDVGRSALASDGNKALAVWVSRYCGGGSPNYAISDATELENLATYLEDTGKVESAADCTDGDLIDTPCLYLEDHFAVAGSQGLSDLADEGYPLVGELPYACLWAARGVILPPGDDGTSTFVWFKAERLTSGVRDANRPEAACVKGAGCVVTWQEDPDGIRPGEGEGPGEGWSGAIAHHETDTWYSYIDWDDFGLVNGDGTYGDFYNDTGDLAEWVDANDSGSPKAAVPMSIPVRLTDNAMCTDPNGQTDKPYCYVDFDGSGTADLCASYVTVEIIRPDLGPEPENVDMCIAEDGRLMRGNTASTRARLGLHGYSTVGDYRVDPVANPIDSAWFTMSYEENKGLGEEEVDAGLVSPDDPTEYTKVDMGKNVWYHTFDMFTPEVGSQGLMLNQPAVYPDDFQTIGSLVADSLFEDYNFMLIEPDPIYETLAGLASTLYQSEIARRPSPITQDWYDAGTTGTVALQLWKQGIIRRGGPADIMGRRFVIPDEFDPTIDNPYDYANMACDTWAFDDGSNPRYVKGFCADPAINLSGNTILDGECGDAETCFTEFPFNDYFDDLDMTDSDGIAKIWSWQQYGVNFGEAAPADDWTLNDEVNSLDDVSWENPYDVAKGHRGFMAGDMILAMYAWSPNWQANTVGHDNYNLYTRRSFDGGQTWSTLPGSFTHTDGITYSGDGTTTCEWMASESTAVTCVSEDVSGECAVCTTYAAGDFEQARNLSQLVGTRETILDPRYSPTTRSITVASVSTASLPAGFDAYVVPYDDDTRNPSRFFMVYETGDNTTVAVGEAEPLDLFYSRAVNWGDDYLVWAEEGEMSGCLPDADDEGDPLAGTGFCNEFDALEGSRLSLSGEAAITSSPGGQFFYAIWNQEDLDKHERLVGSDAWFRRVLFVEDYIPSDDDSGGGDGPGNSDDAPGRNK